jgi:hypothetical protein
MSTLDPNCAEPHDGHVHVYPVAGGRHRAVCKADGDVELGRAASVNALRGLILAHRRSAHGLPDIP